ncbi:radical SAM domain-containing protein [Candidatus Magnetobacterium bavaricum]|uniref:Radical SAM domain-containing protein n=1 Tax=Candidatus Magnetobacterium bavaricum TaxID=29290 RepID=A0A0F3GHD3_9BACT|nr:radical SAM domain-containing protein [Candidatus Magnetobacterium bavaricum]
MAKILFINPIIRQNEKPAHIPYGLSQLVALTVKDGHLVQVLDANAWRPTDQEIGDAMATDKWDVIAIGGLITTYGFIKKAIRIARRVCPSTLIVAGGGFITPIPHDIMRFLPEIDIGVIGEAYETLIEILNHVDVADSTWEEVRGIIFRNKHGETILNDHRPLKEDIDTLPFPAWDLFPVERYFKNSGLLLSEESMSAQRHIGVVASYGCPFKCKYCFHLGLSGELESTINNGKRDVTITNHRKIRHHSPEYMVSMVKHARTTYGIDFVSFLDENFSAIAKKGTWFDVFSDLWVREDLQPKCIRTDRAHHPNTCTGVHWGTSAHAAVVNNDMLVRFKSMGCAHLDYGFESFSDDILRSISKGATVKQNEDAVIMTMKAGIRPIPNQIIGFPDETFESILSNITAWNKLGIQSYPFFATPYPGSEWYFTYKDRIMEQYDGNLEDFLIDLGDATKITAVISKNFNAVELLGLRELMVARDKKRINSFAKVWSSRFNKW